MWDLWPYAFLNENGEPDGFNVELIRMLLGELKIPYVIKLKEKLIHNFVHIFMRMTDLMRMIDMSVNIRRYEDYRRQLNE